MARQLNTWLKFKSSSVTEWELQFPHMKVRLPTCPFTTLTSTHFLLYFIKGALFPAFTLSVALDIKHEGQKQPI